MTRILLCLLLLLAGQCILAQEDQTKPTYCDELPTEFDQIKGKKSPLPRFSTKMVKEYKIQVAILKFSHPGSHPFHQSLIARYRPCESVWVIESRKSFRSRTSAEKLRRELIAMGYKDAFLIEQIGYE